MRKKFLLGILVAAMAFSVVGCGSKKSNTGNQKEVKSLETYVDDTSVTPKEGGTFKLGVYGSPTCIGYPGDILTMMNREASQPCIETLVQVGDDGELEPLLLESFEELPEENKIVLHCRDGVKFHDGTVCDAEAIKYNLETTFDYLALEYPCDISFVVVDDLTLEIQMSQWVRGVTYDLLYEYGKIASPTYLKSVDYDTACFNPVGTGPFVFDSYDVDEKITYKKNENYYGDGPYVDAVEIYIFNDEAGIKSALQTQAIDAVIDAEYTVNADYSAMDGIIKTSRNTLSGCMTYNILFGAEDGTPLADPDVRKAISYACDLKTIADSMKEYGAVYSNQMAPADAYDHTDNVTGYSYDVDKAKELLEQAGYKDGFELTGYYYNAEPISGDIMTMMQAYLSEVNIKLNITPIDIAALSEYLFGGGCDGIIITGNNGTPEQMTAFQEQSMGGSVGSICEPVLADSKEAVDLYDKALLSLTEEDELKYVAEGNAIIYDQDCIATGILTLYPQAYARDYVRGSKIGYNNVTQWSPATVWLDK